MFKITTYESNIINVHYTEFFFCTAGIGTGQGGSKQKYVYVCMCVCVCVCVCVSFIKIISHI